MAEVSSYRPGTPAWVDLATSDPAAAREFYGPLFGWQFDIGADEAGNYTMCLFDGVPVAGLNGRPASEGRDVGWVTYLATDDADASAERVTEHGGRLLMGPLDVGDRGRLVVAFDPAGALFGLWQAGSHAGAARVNEPGTVTWNELVTPDLDTAQDFLSAVCGHGWEDEDTGAGGPRYRVFLVDGRPAGGAMEAPGAAAHWLTYFAVADTEAAVASARSSGATVRAGPAPTRYGPYALLTDPLGGVFAVIASTSQS